MLESYENASSTITTSRAREGGMVLLLCGITVYLHWKFPNVRMDTSFKNRFASEHSATGQTVVGRNWAPRALEAQFENWTSFGEVINFVKSSIRILESEE